MLVIVQRARRRSRSTDLGAIVGRSPAASGGATWPLPSSTPTSATCSYASVGDRDLRARRSSAGSARSPTLILMVACGALGMLAADGIEGAIAGEGDLLLAAGRQRRRARRCSPPGPCCKAARAARRALDEDVDVIGAAVCAAVLICCRSSRTSPTSSPGSAGAAVGAACGFAAAPARARRAPRRVDRDKFTALTPELHRYAVEHSSFRDGVVARGRGGRRGDGRPAR